MLCSNSTKVQVAANIYFTFLYLFILVLVTEHSWVSSRWRLTRPPISVVLNPPTQHHTLRIEALLRTCNTPQCQEMALSLLVDISTKPHLWHLISLEKKKKKNSFQILFQISSVLVTFTHVLVVCVFFLDVSFWKNERRKIHQTESCSAEEMAVHFLKITPEIQCCYFSHK